MYTFLKLMVLTSLLLQGACTSKKKPLDTSADSNTSILVGSGKHGSWQTSATRKQIVDLALSEWQYFGRQVVKLKGSEESIPHVGKWEDDGGPYTARVNTYWRSVGKPNLDGNDCRQPWSAAFVSWVMTNAGVSESSFPAAEAHWTYLRHIIDQSNESYAGLVAHKPSTYKPMPGDLICATRGHGGFTPSLESEPEAVLQEHTRLHCDIVVEQTATQLGVVGGNVRNSVSKTLLDLNVNGTLQPTEQRPWFVVIENKL